MRVVADTSPIHVLLRIGHIEVLPALFETIIIPRAVAKELNQASDLIIRQFIAAPPAWLRTQDPTIIEPIPAIDAGEEAAMNLARQLRADLVLVDDLRARRIALQRGLRILGTMGVLERAAHQGLLELEDAIARVLDTDFHVSEDVVDTIRSRHRQRFKRRKKT